MRVKKMLFLFNMKRVKVCPSEWFIRAVFISFFILYSSLFTYLNAQQKTLAVELSTNTISTCSAIIQTKDGGYLAGGLGPGHSGIQQSYLLKLDSNGTIQWLNVIGSIPNINFNTTNNFCNSVTLNRDGGYGITGYSDIYGESVPNVFVMKFDSAGNSLWSETIGGIRGDIGYSIIQTADKGFAIAGSASSFMLADTDVYVLKLDSAGNVQWTKTIGGTGDNEGYSIIQTKDNGYAITGKTNAYGAGGYDVYLIKLDSGGNLQWTKTIGGGKNDVGNSVIQSRDGGYAITGNTYSFNDTVNGDLYAIKLDSVGNLQWTRTIGGANADAGESIFQTKEGDFAIGGYTSSYGSGGVNLYFIKFDSAGNLKQANTYIGTVNMPNNLMLQTKAGGFAFTGFSSGYLDLLVLDSAGNNCEVSGSGGIISSGGTVSGGGHITLSDSGRVEPAMDTNNNTPEYDWTNICLCRNNNNSGGLGVTLTFTYTGTSCLDDSDNGIILSVSGGISPYTYTWTPSVSDSSSATGLSAGSYTIMVTDSVSDTVTLAITIRDKLPFDVYCTFNNTTCSGIANGGISVYTVSSENSPYTYSWSNGATTDAISGLSAGTYSVTVFDACGDSGIAAMTVGLTTDFSDSAIVINNVSCNSESNGVATISISGGTSPFTYQWSDVNSQTTAVSTGLSAGIYSITVSDACGGAVASSVTITQPFAFSVSIASVTPVSCSGGNTGSALASLTVPLISNFNMDTVVQHFLVPASVTTITLTIVGAAGGNDSYDYPSSAGNGADFIGVCPVIPGHVLSVVVGQQGSGTGGGGASWVYDSNIVLYSPSGTNGLLAIAAGGGGSISWDVTFNHGGYAGGSGGINLVTNATTIGTIYGAPGGTGGNGGDSAGYGAGGAGWLSNGDGAQNFPSEIYGGMDEANHFSATNDGGGFGGGGGGGYHHLAGEGESYGGGGGGYNGGSGFGGGGGSFFIDTLPKVSDSGTGNGFVRIEYIITGYDSTFTYSWSNGETTYMATGLSAGTYSLTVSNSSGCTATTSGTITQPATAINITADSVNTSGGNCNGSAWVQVSGGNNPYSYLWTGGLTTDTITNQCADYYCCTITDANGCMDSACITIEVSTGINELRVNSEELRVYPNPNDGAFTIVLSHAELVSTSQTTIEIYNVLGQKVYTSILPPPNGGGASFAYPLNLSSQPNGVYLYRVLRDDGGIVGSGKVVIQK